MSDAIVSELPEVLFTKDKEQVRNFLETKCEEGTAGITSIRRIAIKLGISPRKVLKATMGNREGVTEVIEEILNNLDRVDDLKRASEEGEAEQLPTPVIPEGEAAKKRLLLMQQLKTVIKEKFPEMNRPQVWWASATLEDLEELKQELSEKEASKKLEEELEKEEKPVEEPVQPKKATMKMSKKELASWAERLGLDPRGRKQALVDRINTHISGGALEKSDPLPSEEEEGLLVPEDDTPSPKAPRKKKGKKETSAPHHNDPPPSPVLKTAEDPLQGRLEDLHDLMLEMNEVLADTAFLVGEIAAHFYRIPENVRSIKEIRALIERHLKRPS